MSSCLPLIFMALTSFLVLPKSGSQAAGSDSIADLLLADEIEKAESLLDKQPRNATSMAFRGEIEFRRGNFDQAEALYRESLTADEKTARAHFGLGKLALARLNTAEALRQFKRAIALTPGDAIFYIYLAEAYGIEKKYAEQQTALQQYLKLNPREPDRLAEAKSASEMLTALGGKDIGVTLAPAIPAPIPFQRMLNLLFVEAKVNGKGPYKFVLDTGATQVVLSEKVETELGLKPVTTTIMHGVGGGGRVESKLYKVSELSIGDVKITNLPVGTFTDPLVTQLADGIIGTAVLSDLFVNVNYPGNTLVVTKKAPAPLGEALGGRYFSNLLLVPLEVNGKFRGNFVVDTGAVTTVLSHSMAAKLGVNETTPGAKVEMGVAGVGGVEGAVLRVAGVTFKTGGITEVFPQVVSIDLKQISKMIGTEVSGVIGYDFLEAYSIYLNYKTAEVRLVR